MHTVVSVGFGAPSVTVLESAGNFSMRVRLNRLAAVPVTVTLVTEDGTAIDGEGKVVFATILYSVACMCTRTHTDYRASSIPSSLTIPAGTMEVTFTGDIIVDYTPGEGVESFTIRITSTSPSGVTISQETTEVFITDITGEFTYYYNGETTNPCF